MRQSRWIPSIVTASGPTVCLVADDFGLAGSAWREADLHATDVETVIKDRMAGQYRRPLKVVAFNAAEKWSEDISKDVAREIQRRCDAQFADVPSHL